MIAKSKSCLIITYNDNLIAFT